MADIIHRIAIKAPVSKVHAAVATPEGVTGWWTKETTGSSKLGGAMKVLFRSLAGTEIGKMDFELLELGPSKVCWRFTAGPAEWLGTTVTFDLSEANGQTLILFGHRGWPQAEEFMAHCSMKWATFLLSLRDFVETGTGKPAPNDVKIDTWN